MTTVLRFYIVILKVDLTPCETVDFFSVPPVHDDSRER